MSKDFTFYHLSEEFDKLYLTVLSNKEYVKLNDKIFKGYDYKLVDVMNKSVYITNYWIDIPKENIDKYIKSFGIETVIHSDKLDINIPTNIIITDDMYNTIDFRYSSELFHSYNRMAVDFYFKYIEYMNNNINDINLCTFIKRIDRANKIIISKTKMMDVI